MKQQQPLSTAGDASALRQLAADLCRLRDAMNTLSLVMKDCLLDVAQVESQSAKAEFEELVRRLK